jgi:opacity protein-like surface antigen
MKTSIRTFSLILLFITIASVSTAQDLSLKGRSAIELNLGFWGGSNASNTIAVTGIQSEAKTSGFAGGLGYSYWLRENLSLTMTVNLLTAQASSTVSTSIVTQQASAVIPLLLGIRFYVPYPESDANVRPFLSAAIGTYFGSEAKNTTLSQQAHTETTFGGRLGAGIDFFLGDHFKLDANVGYHQMADFETAIGARKNYNGADFSLGAGYIF